MLFPFRSIAFNSAQTPIFDQNQEAIPTLSVHSLSFNQSSKQYQNNESLDMK